MSGQFIPRRSRSGSSSTDSSIHAGLAEAEDVGIEDSSPGNEDSSSAEMPSHSRERRDSSSSFSSRVSECNYEEEEDIHQAFLNQEPDAHGIRPAIIRPVKPLIGPRSRIQRTIESRPPIHVPTCSGVENHYAPKPQRKQSIYDHSFVAVVRPQTSKESCKLVVDYLISEGYREVAEILCREAGIELPIDELKNLDGRVAIRNAIVMGNALEAIKLTTDLCPGLLETDLEVRFNLHQQHILEMIRIRQVEEAMAYAEQNLGNYDGWNQEQIERIEKTFALLAFDDPFESPYKMLLNQDQRNKMATEVNCAVLRYQNRPSTSRLEALLRLVVWGQKQLVEKQTGQKLQFSTDHLAKEIFMNEQEQNYDFGTSI